MRRFARFSQRLNSPPSRFKTVSSLMRKPPESSVEAEKKKPWVGLMRLLRLSTVSDRPKVDVMPEVYSSPPKSRSW